jgi:septin family protein
MLRRAFESNPSMSVSTHNTSWPALPPKMTTPELEEDGVRIALTIVDTPGFGDNIDNEFAYVVFKLHTQSHILTLS